MSEDLSHDDVRGILNLMAEGSNEYAGIPMAVHGERIVVHPSYRFASVFAKEPEPEDEWILVNSWLSTSKAGHYVVIMRHRVTGRIIGGLQPAPNKLTMEFSTFGCSIAWTMECENKAMQLLQGMVRPHTFRHYLLTGMFLETSTRSGLTYLFRRLRPTLVIKTSDTGCTCLCALCLHPIGYYAGTWAGVMVPTDEVIAHLTMMRGDEPYFWRHANQHPAWHPGAGL